ncbi:MAG: DUF898 family protein [Rhodospirillaceae bacterium]
MRHLLDDPNKNDIFPRMTYTFPIFVISVIIFSSFAWIVKQALFALERNLIFSHMTMDGGHAFLSTVHPGRLMWIEFSNIVLIICTLTLARPWCEVRYYRYLAENITVLINGDLEDIVGEQAANQGNVTAAEFVDLEVGGMGL